MKRPFRLQRSQRPSSLSCALRTYRHLVDSVVKTHLYLAQQRVRIHCLIQVVVDLEVCGIDQPGAEVELDALGNIGELPS